MSIDARGERFVGKVSATFQLTCLEMDAGEVTQRLEVQPTWTSWMRTMRQGLPVGRDGCEWHYETGSAVTSLDISDHVKELLRRFLPLKSRLEELRPPPLICVSIYWESTILDCMTAPRLAADCVAGLAELGASLRFHAEKIDNVHEA